MPACSWRERGACFVLLSFTMNHPVSEQRFVKFADISPKEVAPGMSRKVMAFGPDLMSVHVTFKKGAIGAAHRHPHRQISCVVKGSFKVRVGDETRILGEGDHFYAPADVEHGVEALEDGVLVDMFTPHRADFVG